MRATDSPNNNLITEKSVAKGNDLKTFHLYQCKYRAKQKSPEQKFGTLVCFCLKNGAISHSVSASRR